MQNCTGNFPKAEEQELLKLLDVTEENNVFTIDDLDEDAKHLFREEIKGMMNNSLLENFTLYLSKQLIF